MKITKQRLQKIIQEEINVYKASQLNESIDMDTLENLEVAIKMAYEEMTTPTDVDQTYADTGEPVSKDPQDMHDKAVEFLKGIVEDVASGEMPSSPRTINEDGHGDVESSRRASTTRRFNVTVTIFVYCSWRTWHFTASNIFDNAFEELNCFIVHILWVF